MINDRNHEETLLLMRSINRHVFLTFSIVEIIKLELEMLIATNCCF